ncbi:flagellar basal body rod protein FlgB [Microaerobacter geothermalis]|uniref:flagellar basal body rod protein FlgB n=1 Tax=Microaerobacter geothermalis TaxID=674972 RepID=UPI001F3AB459|nr:flagellar basal body rod protein FlgB [Microaerobacter geothermalis]MCF6093843.1 flagellar basal body rod protein FlgB [Microaerobacter geothermalis]
MNLFEGQTLRILTQGLDATAMRQRVLANNIANVDTPNYKRQDVSFSSIFQEALNRSASSFTGYRTNSKHIPIGGDAYRKYSGYQVITDHQTNMNNNGNNVDIDFEMSQLAQNQIFYNALVEETNSYFSKLRIVINEGRR